MKKDNTEQPDAKGFEGLYFDEIWDTNFQIPEYVLQLDLQKFSGESQHRIVKAEYQPRPEDRFYVETNFLPDNPEEYLSVDLGVPQSLCRHTLQIMANKLSHILASDKVSDEFKDGLASVVIGAADEAQIHLDNPLLIKAGFPLVIESLDLEYGKGVFSALQNLLESDLVDPVEDELKQFEIPFRQVAPAQAADRSSIEGLAQELADILKNPDTPKNILDCLKDELSEITEGCFDDYVYSPEVIAKGLRNQKERQNA